MFKTRMDKMSKYKLGNNKLWNILILESNKFLFYSEYEKIYCLWNINIRVVIL